MASTQLTYEQKGRTWICQHAQLSRWPFRLIARNVYHGTGRLLTDLTLTRVIEGGPRTQEIGILTAHVDLLTITRRTGFSKEAARRLRDTVDSNEQVVESTLGAMIDGLQEHLLHARNSIEVFSATDIELPEDLTPPYAIWPLVPASRPGMLIAPSGTGKSAFALMAGLAVVTGKSLLERVVPRSEGPVLYVGQEEDRYQWAARLAMICRGHQIERPKHYYYVRLPEASLPDAADALAEVAAVRRAKMVIVDSAQATWGSEGEGSIRGYATQWFNALAEIGVPVLVIEHPNLANTMKGNASAAAGAGVKQDRVGHQWGMRSLPLPVRDGQPYRYHATLTDTKRNYVARQDDINYLLMVYRHDWMKFNEAEALTAEGIVSASPTAQDDILASLMHGPGTSEDGLTVAEMTSRTGAPDDRNIRRALDKDVWRPASWMDGLLYRFEQVEGTGTNRKTDPARFKLVTQSGSEAVQLSMAPGDPEEPS